MSDEPDPTSIAVQANELLREYEISTYRKAEETGDWSTLIALCEKVVQNGAHLYAAAFGRRLAAEMLYRAADRYAAGDVE